MDLQELCNRGIIIFGALLELVGMCQCIEVERPKEVVDSVLSAGV